MGCNCKAKEKIDEIEEIISDNTFEESFEKKNLLYYSLLVLNKIVYWFKILVISLGIIILTPFVSLFVIWGFVTKRQVVLKVPKQLREN